MSEYKKNAINASSDWKKIISKKEIIKNMRKQLRGKKKKFFKSVKFYRIAIKFFIPFTTYK